METVGLGSSNTVDMEQNKVVKAMHVKPNDTMALPRVTVLCIIFEKSRQEEEEEKGTKKKEGEKEVLSCCCCHTALSFLGHQSGVEDCVPLLLQNKTTTRTTNQDQRCLTGCGESSTPGCWSSVVEANG